MSGRPRRGGDHPDATPNSFIGRDRRVGADGAGGNGRRLGFVHGRDLGCQRSPRHNQMKKIPIASATGTYVSMSAIPTSWMSAAPFILRPLPGPAPASPDSLPQHPRRRGSNSIGRRQCATARDGSLRLPGGLSASTVWASMPPLRSLRHPG
jgi:hypothetical protein